MQRFKYEDNELLPILQAGDLITVNGSPVEIVDSGALAVTLKPVTVLWSVDVHLTET